MIITIIIITRCVFIILHIYWNIFNVFIMSRLVQVRFTDVHHYVIM